MDYRRIYDTLTEGGVIASRAEFCAIVGHNPRYLDILDSRGGQLPSTAILRLVAALRRLQRHDLAEQILNEALWEVADQMDGEKDLVRLFAPTERPEPRERTRERLDRLAALRGQR